MKIAEYIEDLEKLISDIKDFDQNLPVGMVTTAPHLCCSSCSSEDRCYVDGEDFPFDTLIISKEMQYDKKDKTQKLKKLWIRGQ